MKISFLGAGQVGGQAAYLAASDGFADICLFDIREGLAIGKALDIGQALAFSEFDIAVTGGHDIRVTAGSDVLVVTAGVSRRPGMTREDLLGINANTLRSLLLPALESSPDAVVIVVTNPVNTMTYLAAMICGIPKSRILGMAGLLDNARFAYFIAHELKCELREIQSWVIGDHGEHIVPVASRSSVRGRVLSEWLEPEQLAEIYAKTRSAGTQIVNCLQNGSAFIAPGAAILRMLRLIAGKEVKPVPASAYLNGEYGVSGLVAGVPVSVGKRGVQEIIDLAISDLELDAFRKAVSGIHETNHALHGLMSDLGKNAV